jgi:porin
MSLRFNSIIVLITLVYLFGSGCTSSWAQDWSAVKDSLAARGIMPSVIYDANMLSNLDGGLQRGTILQGNAYLQLLIDGEKFVGFPGLRIYLSELGTHGPNAGAFVGDAQGVSNMTAPSGFRSYEGWLQYNFLNNQWSVLVGQLVLSETAHKNQVGAFLQLAQQVNRFGSYIGAGIAAQGVVAGRPNDEIGLGVASAHNGFSYMQSQLQLGLPVNRAETAFEGSGSPMFNMSSSSPE